jgi:hypothetical protein
MSDFFSSLVDRAAGRGPLLDRRIPPHFELPRGRSTAPESIAQDSTIQPAIEEIFQETRRLEAVPPPRKTPEPPELPDPPRALSAVAKPSPVAKPRPIEKPAEVRETSAPSKRADPPRVITKVERVVEPVAPVGSRAAVKPGGIEPLAAGNPNAGGAPLADGKSERTGQPRAVSPAVEVRTRVKQQAARATPPTAIQPRVAARAPQVIVQRERSAAATVQVTIGRIEIRAAGGAGSSAATSRPSSGPKLSLEDYLRNRAGGSR